MVTIYDHKRARCPVQARRAVAQDCNDDAERDRIGQEDQKTTGGSCKAVMVKLPSQDLLVTGSASPRRGDGADQTEVMAARPVLGTISAPAMLTK
jgi:hypothetical protein